MRLRPFGCSARRLRLPWPTPACPKGEHVGGARIKRSRVACAVPCFLVGEKAVRRHVRAERPCLATRLAPLSEAAPQRHRTNRHVLGRCRGEPRAGQRRAAAATGGSNAVTAGRRIAFEERSDPGSHADRSETAHLEHGEGEAVGNPLPAVVTHRRRRWEVGAWVENSDAYWAAPQCLAWALAREAGHTAVRGRVARCRAREGDIQRGKGGRARGSLAFFEACNEEGRGNVFEAFRAVSVSAFRVSIGGGFSSV
ncbi:hypothetical protein, conserved in T. vivax [Trypanosoma vivax Y486]|uniref:Uncharacterized protein n=1 Tax=Trypanosoma vivax (strain Y486) TaxID=1055687 RepID=F9WT55_TRYVY|nr:hypothetical protein, conserved in T. vivax [Trypanosoma vivax Y486]|eukprot:CCD20746.1 hypothetical protein, conserved in T. vivax [Trypanosoma vivax Y486]